MLVEEKFERAERVEAREDSLDEKDTVVDEELDRAGGCGFFQIYAQLFITLGMVSMGFWHLNLGYMLQIPQYECTYLGSTEGFIPCDQVTICSSDPAITDWRVDWDSKKSLNNWIVTFDWHCKPAWMLALPGACSFIGWTLGSFFLPPMSDIYGRKMFVLAG